MQESSNGVITIAMCGHPVEKAQWFVPRGCQACQGTSVEHDFDCLHALLHQTMNSVGGLSPHALHAVPVSTAAPTPIAYFRSHHSMKSASEPCMAFVSKSALHAHAVPPIQTLNPERPHQENIYPAPFTQVNEGTL